MIGDVPAVLQRAKALRDAGVVHTLWSLDPELEQPDDVVKLAGFRGIGDAWLETDAEAIQRHLARALHRDLAYDVEVMGAQVAEDLARSIVELMRHRSGARWFSNRKLGPERSYASTPVANATFEWGFVALGGGAALLVWLEDED
jgi:hypothetical protein